MSAFFFALAYDLMSTDRKNFNVTIWYNSTYSDEFSTESAKLVRVPRSINLVTNYTMVMYSQDILSSLNSQLHISLIVKLQISNAYLKFLKGLGTKILFEFVKEVPKQETKINQDIASLLGPLFFTWVVLLLFPVSFLIYYYYSS